MSLIEKYYGKGLLSDEQVKRIRENVSGFAKEAALSDAFKAAALGALGTTAIGAAIAGAHRGADILQDKATRKKDFQSMIKAKPELRKQDPKKVQMAFNSLRRVSPDMSKDPFIASSYVEQAVLTDSPFVGMQTLKDFRARPGKSLHEYSPVSLSPGDITKALDRETELKLSKGKLQELKQKAEKSGLDIEKLKHQKKLNWGRDQTEDMTSGDVWSMMGSKKGRKK